MNNFQKQNNTMVSNADKTVSPQAPKEVTFEMKRVLWFWCSAKYTEEGLTADHPVRPKIGLSYKHLPPLPAFLQISLAMPGEQASDKVMADLINDFYRWAIIQIRSLDWRDAPEPDVAKLAAVAEFVFQTPNGMNRLITLNRKTRERRVWEIEKMGPAERLAALKAIAEEWT